MCWWNTWVDLQTQVWFIGACCYLGKAWIQVGADLQVSQAVHWAKMMHKRIKTFRVSQQNQESLLKTTRPHWNGFERLARALIKRYWGHQRIEKGSAGRRNNHDFRSRSWVIKTSFPVKRKHREVFLWAILNLSEGLWRTGLCYGRFIWTIA